MEGFGGSGFSGAKCVTRKQRTSNSRRPRRDMSFVLECLNVSPPSSTPSSDNASKQSPDESRGYAALSRKKNRRDDQKYGNLEEFYGNGSSRGGRHGSTDHGRNNNPDLRKCSEDVLAPGDWKSVNKLREGSKMQSEGHNLDRCARGPNGSSESKLKKVKLKLGGVIRTIHANSDDKGGPAAKPPRSSDVPRYRQKLILQDDSDDDNGPTEKGNVLLGVQSKDLHKESFSGGVNEVSRGKAPEKSLHGCQTDRPHIIPSSEAVRKSKRVPKRRALDGGVDEDDEIHYHERQKSSKAVADHNIEHGDGGDDNARKLKFSKVPKGKRTAYEVDEDFGSARPAKDVNKKMRTGRELGNADYVEEEKHGSSDGGSDADRKMQKELADEMADVRTEALTTRQRGSLIEFPDGLPPVPSRRQKGKLSEAEQQAKKAEAAQRRRLQVEKQAREQEAEAIRKILGQDSSRKKKEEKERKERDEKAHRKAAESVVVASNTIRWVMGPTGTVVIFAEDVNLPSIFGSKTSSYPPPREKCAGPSCTNPYKYRHSKLNLPLCSLQCYQAVQKLQPNSIDTAMTSCVGGDHT